MTPNNNDDHFTIITIIGPTINSSDASLKSITHTCNFTIAKSKTEGPSAFTKLTFIKWYHKFITSYTNLNLATKSWPNFKFSNFLYSTLHHWLSYLKYNGHQRSYMDTTKHLRRWCVFIKLTYISQGGAPLCGLGGKVKLFIIQQLCYILQLIQNFNKNTITSNVSIEHDMSFLKLL